MKIKLDENLPHQLVPLLTGPGHDVDTVPDEQIAGRDDAVVWAAAQAAGRFLVTQDLDFSDARKYAPGTHHGLLLVRLPQPGRSALFDRVATLFRTEPVHDWIGGACYFVDVLAAGGACTGEDELADEAGVLHHQGLGDHAAERKREDVDLLEAEDLDEGHGVVGHRLDTVGNLAGRAAGAAVVEGDDMVVPGDGIDDARVPVVEVRGEMEEEDDWNSALGPKFAIGVGHAASGNRAGGRVLVCGDDDLAEGNVCAHDAYSSGGCRRREFRAAATNAWW